VRTHPVDKLLEQHCYKSAAGLLQIVRCYRSANKLLQIRSQEVDKLSSYCLFPVVVTSLVQAVSNL
jgi:hypothetical protein